jgi:5-methylcytosine-specific restriction endonuclease McrA
MSSNKKPKVIAVLDVNGKFLSFCTRQRAKKVVQEHKGYFIADRTLKLKTSKVKEARDRREVIKEAKRICYICNRRISDKETATVDHVIPKSRDEFATNKFNLKCCCEHCNNDKADMTLLEYIQHIRYNRKAYDYISNKRLNHLEQYAITYEKEYYDFYIKYADKLGGNMNE